MFYHKASYLGSYHKCLQQNVYEKYSDYMQTRKEKKPERGGSVFI